MDFKQTIEYISMFTKDDNTKKLCEIIIENMWDDKLTQIKEYLDTQVSSEYNLFDDTIIYCEKKEHAEELWLSMSSVSYPIYYVSVWKSFGVAQGIPEEHEWKEIVKSSEILMFTNN